MPTRYALHARYGSGSSSSRTQTRKVPTLILDKFTHSLTHDSQDPACLEESELGQVEGHVRKDESQPSHFHVIANNSSRPHGTEETYHDADQRTSDYIIRQTPENCNHRTRLILSQVPEEYEEDHCRPVVQ
jgi:hypothetical protein